MSEQPPIHYATGLPMAPCPSCGKLSGLSGIDGRECLACTGGYAEELVKGDQSVRSSLFARIFGR